MNLSALLKARGAAAKQSKGDMEGAIQLYQEAIDRGASKPIYILHYSVLLIRKGDYQKARELLVKYQKSAGLTAEQKVSWRVNYAACVYRMGELEKAIDVLERLHAINPCGMIYQTLGYLYVEAGDLEKAMSFNLAAIGYDEEDPVCLDNLAQTYYRLANDKEKAKTYFDKAYSIKPTQIDTLYFLAMYDAECGDLTAAKEKLDTALDGRFSPLNYATPEKITELLEKYQMA